MQLTQRSLAAAAGISNGDASLWLDPINKALVEFGITKPLDVAMFIAQIGHESMGFKASVESFNYSVDGLINTFVKVRVPRMTLAQAQQFGRQPGEKSVPLVRQMGAANTVYGGRMGNTQPNDGWNYRGRGPIQTTGRTNYDNTGKAIGLDLIKNPDLLREPTNGIRAAAHFFVSSGCLNYTDNILKCTQLINGGTNGLDDRKARYAKAKGVLAP